MDMPPLDGDTCPVKYALPGLTVPGKGKGAVPQPSKGQLYVDLGKLVSPALVARVKTDPIKHAASFKTAVWRCLTKLGVNKHAPVNYLGGMVFGNVIDTDGFSASVHYVAPSLFGATRYNGGFGKLKEAQRAQTRSGKARGAIYVTDLSADERQAICFGDGTKVNCDPGKGCIACLTDGCGKTLSYTSAQRRRESGAGAIAEAQRRLLDAPLDGGGGERRTARMLQSTIGRIQAAGTVSWSSKSTISEHFEHYLTTRRAVAGELSVFYRRRSFRAARYDAFVGRRASEDRFFSKAKAAFGHDAVILYGDWGRNPNIPHQPPSPGVGFRRRMCSHFRVLLVHESYTSSICPRCGTAGMIKPRKNRDGREIHHLLRCPNRGCSCHWWHRDVLGALNIGKTGTHALETGAWHPAFCAAAA